MNLDHLHRISLRLAERLGVAEADAEAALREVLDEADRELVITGRVYGYRRYGEDECNRGYVRIPFMAKTEDAAPLKRVIARASDRTGVSQFNAIALMTFVWEAIAQEVSSGSVVRIPGWGMYGPWLWNPDGGDSGDAAVYPRFVPARPFRQEVREMCPPELAKNSVLRNFQRSHHPSSRSGSTSRTMTTMESWRGHISRQSGGSV
jgi:hypothetical protein